MRTWYIPSTAGDFRLSADSSNAGESLLTVHDPTPLEAKALVEFLAHARKKAWLDEAAAARPLGLVGTTVFELAAPVVTAGPVLAKMAGYKGKAKLTAFKSESGKLSATTDATLPVEKGEAPTEAVTVRRPTPSCPWPVESPADIRAEEVLLAFLDDENAASWRRHRIVHCDGGETGHRYRIAARDSRTAAKQGRICADLTDWFILHFHDSMRPPAEEVLAAWLILQFREPWLRNEATCIGTLAVANNVFKNPFGGVLDGVGDAGLARGVGRLFVTDGPMIDDEFMPTVGEMLTAIL